jgi:hypothetical protein
MVTWHGPKMVQCFTSRPLKKKRIETRNRQEGAIEEAEGFERSIETF